MKRTASSIAAVLTAALGLAAAALVPAGAAPAGPAGAGRGGGKAVTIDVVSDIQGDTGDFGRALDQMRGLPGSSSALVVNGDITNRGYPHEYAEVRATLDAHPHPGRTFFTIGNHEFYVPKYCDPGKLCQGTWPNGTPESRLFQNFYDFTGLDKVYYERVVDGVPMLMLGTEKYMKYHDATKWDEVWMSDEQLNWLASRLEHWERQGKPVLVFSHHVLPDTVSGTRNRLYSGDYLQANRLLKILGRHEDAVLFTSHTHWDLGLSDWAVRKVVPGTGNLRGFTVVNTGAVQTQWTDDGKGGETALSGMENSGLRVTVGKKEIVVKARDYLRDRWVKELRIPLTR
ncbi:metallophosphoesterase family protein [Streptomyces pactum]|uniref:metallophosphoesterase family protein n=1 Tax=Streptomyces pactum TaxID=68249 RepID=UPI0036FE283D